MTSPHAASSLPAEADPPLCSTSALARILDLEALSNANDPNGPLRFRGLNLREGTYWPRVFGGQLIGQSLVAASRSVIDAAFTVHSLHAYFLLPGDPKRPFIYTVSRLRDGRSFASRRVQACHERQPGDTEEPAVVFEMLCSFQRTEAGFDRATSPPVGVPRPERLPTQADRLRAAASHKELPASLRTALAARAEIPFPMDVRVVRPGGSAAHLPPKQQAWLRCPERLGDDPNLHRCVLAYGSDFALLDTAALPHKSGQPGGGLTMASLDHSMWFHRPMRADEWLLYDMNSPTAQGGRALAFGQLFNERGELVATVAQEGVLRSAGGGGEGRRGRGKGGSGALRAKL